MTRPQALGVLLVVLGLVYVGLYFARQRKRQRHTSASGAVASGPRLDAAPGIVSGSRGEDSDREPGLQVAGTEADHDVRAEGTYISTTTALSPHERVTVEGLGHRSEAVLLVHRGDAEHLVEFQRAGEQDLFITADRLKAFRRDRGMAGKFMGTPRLAVLTWRADDGALYETGFLPRHRADLERIEAALWWHTGAREVQEPVHPSEPGLTADYAEDSAPGQQPASDASPSRPKEEIAAVPEDPVADPARQDSARQDSARQEGTADAVNAQSKDDA